MVCFCESGNYASQMGGVEEYGEIRERQEGGCQWDNWDSDVNNRDEPTDWLL